jgi:hypothetical protein
MKREVWKIYTEFYPENLKGKEDFGYPGVEVKLILKQI